MADSSVLRKRGGGTSPTAQLLAKPSKILSTQHRSHPDDGDNDLTGASRGGNGVVGRNITFILKVASASFMLLGLFKLLMFVSNPSPRSRRSSSQTLATRNLGTINMLSTVPLGFSLNLPIDLDALEVYLDSRHFRSIDTVESSHSTTTTDNDETANEMQHFFGTCDIKDHGENDVRKHAFSLGDTGLGAIDSSIYLKPGEHIIEIYHRRAAHNNDLLPRAHMTVNVDAPPELLLGSSSFFRKSPYETAYQLALSEMGKNIACNHFVAGTGWSQLWTRDTSFAAELGAALLHPAVVKQSLMASVGKWKDGKQVWLQDTCGHFGGWPNLSDAIVGVRGAWSLYLVTGDKE